MNGSFPRRLRGEARKARDLGWVRREDAGESLAEIAQADGVSPEWVSKCVTRARREYGLDTPVEVADRRRERQRATAEVGRRSRSESLRSRDDSFLDMWESGQTQESIAESAGVTAHAVHMAIRRARKRRDGA